MRQMVQNHLDDSVVVFTGKYRFYIFLLSLFGVRPTAPDTGELPSHGTKAVGVRAAGLTFFAKFKVGINYYKNTPKIR